MGTTTARPTGGAWGGMSTGWEDSGPVRFRLHGGDIQSLELLLEPGDEVTCEPRAFIAARGGVTRLGVSWGRGVLAPLKRMWAGEAAILTRLACRERPATVLVGAAQYGRIVAVRVRPGQAIICQRGAYMASSGAVDVSVAFTSRLSAGFFGGSGLVFCRLSGDGHAFLHGLGVVSEWVVLPNEEATVSTHNVLAFEERVGYRVQLSGGPMTWMFGGDGAFLTQLAGPGRVFVQSIDPVGLERDRAARRGRGGRRPRERGPGGGAGAAAAGPEEAR